MAYDFVKYRITFKDKHYATPITWRIDIKPESGLVPAEPIQLRPSATPLVLEYTNTDESKRSWIMGRKATIRYVYTGEANIPLPTEFFDTDERFNRVEIYKNNVLDGVYYIKPDNCQYDYRFPPFDISLVAVDGLAYAKTVNFNIYQSSGLLKYEQISLYEAIVTRALQTIIDEEVPLNVINTLSPENIEVGARLLLGTLVHTDIFYDFVTGPISVYDVLEYFCKTFYARIFIAQNQVWFIRTSDLDQDSFVIDQYEEGGTGGNITIPGFINMLGPNIGLFDGVPVDFNALVRLEPAVKKASFKLDFKAINQLLNFDWSVFNGTDYTSWTRFGAPGITVERAGTGAIEDPYRLKIPFVQPPGPSIIYLFQNTPADTISAGDILQTSFRFKYNNCDSFKIQIRVGILGFEVLTLDSSGSWIYDFSFEPVYIEFKRSGKKKTGSFDLKSVPVPATFEAGTFPPNAFIQFKIFQPTGLNVLDRTEPSPTPDPATAWIEIWPVKLGVSSTNSLGRKIIAVNQANFSGEQEETTFQFIDTGEDGLSNTLFVEDGPASTWVSSKAGIDEADIEQHMAQANIDQYAKSVTTFESSVYSNTIEFYNIFTVDTLTGRRFMTLADKYDVRECMHDLLLGEILPEQGATVDYTEIDIEESED